MMNILKIDIAAYLQSRGQKSEFSIRYKCYGEETGKEGNELKV